MRVDRFGIEHGFMLDDGGIMIVAPKIADDGTISALFATNVSSSTELAHVKLAELEKRWIGAPYANWRGAWERPAPAITEGKQG